MTDQSTCGCVWERKPGFGDVIVQQCAEHAAQSASPESKAAFAAADRAVLKLRMRGVLGWPEQEPKIDWVYREKSIAYNVRFWATPDPWVARRASTRTVDAHITRRLLDGQLRVPAGWDCSDYLGLIQAGEQQ